MTYLLVGTVACLIGLHWGRRWERERALSAMQAAYVDVPLGPRSIPCLQLRMRWQLNLENCKGSSVADDESRKATP